MKPFDPESGTSHYEHLEHEVKKRRLREENELLMAEYLARGGKVRRVGVKGAPKPKFKYMNRRQRELAGKDSE